MRFDVKHTLFFAAILLFGCDENEKSVSQSIFEACGLSATQKILVVEREVDIPISIQGYWYSEQAVVELSQSDLAAIENSLEENKEYAKNKEFMYESFIAGKHLKSCTIIKPKLRLEYSLIYW